MREVKAVLCKGGSMEQNVVVLTCMDKRFHRRIESVVRTKLGGKDFYFIAVAGAGQAFIHDGRRIIENGIKLARPGLLIVVEHEDCAAYGGSTAFKTKEEERTKHKYMVEDLKNVCARLFPTMTVEGYWAMLDGATVPF